MLLNYILMTAHDKNDPIWYPKSIPSPTDMQGLAKAGRILMTAFEPQTRFLKQWSIEAETVGMKGEKKQRHFTTMTT